MDEDIYSAFLKARNVSERLLRSHSAESGSFARGYHMEHAREEFAALADLLGYNVIKRQPAPSAVVTILPLDAEEEAA